MIVGVSGWWSGRCGDGLDRVPGVDQLRDPGPVLAQVQPPFALPTGQNPGASGFAASRVCNYDWKRSITISDD